MVSSYGSTVRLLENVGYAEKWPFAVGRILQDVLGGQRGIDLVRAHHVAQGDHLRRRWDLGRVELVDGPHVVEDRGELFLEAGLLRLVEPEPSKERDVLDVLSANRHKR